MALPESLHEPGAALQALVRDFSRYTALVEAESRFGSSTRYVVAEACRTMYCAIGPSSVHFVRVMSDGTLILAQCCVRARVNSLGSLKLSITKEVGILLLMARIIKGAYGRDWTNSTVRLAVKTRGLG